MKAMAATKSKQANAKPMTAKARPGGRDIELVIITGMSGSGKVSALKVFEDLGFYCVDNLPVDLISQFAELTLQSSEIQKCAVVADVREGPSLKRLPSI